MLQPALAPLQLTDAHVHSLADHSDHHHDDCTHELSPMRLMPRLTPVTLEPHRQSGNAVPLAMLSQIEKVGFKYTAEHGGATYFVMDVYLHNVNTRLPISSTLLSRLRLRSSAPEREPDYRIGARFSDFSGLRAEISDLLCMNARFTCEYCESFNEYIKFRLTQPRWIVKIGTRVELRKSILESFINDFLNMTLKRTPCDSKCQVRAKAPFLMERFLKRRYPRGQAPPSIEDTPLVRRTSEPIDDSEPTN